MCGSSLLMNNAPQQNGKSWSNMTITQEYPKEQDLLHKKTPVKQQNHYIYQKDTIQMKRNIVPILKKRNKSASASKVIQNKENLTEIQQQHVLANNRCQSSKVGHAS